MPVPAGYEEDAAPTISFVPKGYTENASGLSNLPSSINGSQTGSRMLDALTEHVTGGPLNPTNWLSMLKSAFDSPISEDNFAQAQRLIDASEKNGNILPIITGKEDANMEDLAGGFAGDAINGAVLAAVSHGLSKIPKIKGATGYADPVKDYFNIYGNSDPTLPEKIPTALSDIREHSPVPIEHNEHLASTSPNGVALKSALKANRDAMDAWHRPVQEEGRVADPRPILQASAESLKEMEDPETRLRLLRSAANKLLQEPLTADRMKALLEEKNGELASFYDKDPGVQEAAKQAGAVSGRSQALLEAQAKAIRDQYYGMLDPQNNGAGPREIQQRYGGIKAVQDDATANRMKILAETAGTSVDKLIDAAKTAASVAGKGFIGGHLGGPGGALIGLSELPEIATPYRGESDPVIRRMFRNAPDYKPLPEAPPMIQRYPKQLPAGDNVIITPPPADGSYVRGADGMRQPPNPAKALPPASTIFQGDVSPGSGEGPRPYSRELPIKPDESGPTKEGYAVNSEVKANDAAASHLFGKRSYSELDARRRSIVDHYRRTGSLRVQDMGYIGR